MIFKAVRDSCAREGLFVIRTIVFLFQANSAGFFKSGMGGRWILGSVLYDKGTYVHEKRIWGGGRRICAYAPTFPKKYF